MTSLLRPFAALLNAIRRLFARPRPHQAIDDEEDFDGS